MGILLQVFGCLDSLSCQHSCMESSIGVLHMAKGHLTQPHTPQLGETVCCSSLGVPVPAHTSHHWILATMSSAARFGVLVRMRDLGTSLSHGSSGAGSPLAVAHSHKHQHQQQQWCGVSHRCAPKDGTAASRPVTDAVPLAMKMLRRSTAACDGCSVIQASRCSCTQLGHCKCVLPMATPCLEDLPLSTCSAAAAAALSSGLRRQASQKLWPHVGRTRACSV